MIAPTYIKEENHLIINSLSKLLTNIKKKKTLIYSVLLHDFLHQTTQAFRSRQKILYRQQYHFVSSHQQNYNTYTQREKKREEGKEDSDKACNLSTQVT